MTRPDGAGPAAEDQWEWDVALSFAGAQRDYVEKVAATLKRRGIRCFYDADEQIELWGRYLAEELPAIYAERAAAVVIFVSAEYAERDWTRLERRAALGRAVREREEYVLPARFDDTPLPGLLSDLVAMDLRWRTPEQFADIIEKKLVALDVLDRDTPYPGPGDRETAPAPGPSEAEGKPGDLPWRLPVSHRRSAVRRLLAVTVILGAVAYGADLAVSGLTGHRAAIPTRPAIPLGALTGSGSGGGVSAMAFSADGQTLAEGTESTEGTTLTVRLWNVAAPGRALRAGTVSVPFGKEKIFLRQLAFAGDGRTLAAAADNSYLGWVTLWTVSDPAHPTARATLSGPGLGAPMALSPDGGLLAASDGSKVFVWNITGAGRPKELATLTDQDNVLALEFSPDGRTLLVAPGDGRGGANLWDLTVPDHPRIAATVKGSMLGAGFSPDGRTLALSGADHKVTLRDVSRPGRMPTVTTLVSPGREVVDGLVFTPDGRRIVTTHDGAHIPAGVAVWDRAHPAGRTPTEELAFPGEKTPFFALSRDGRTIAAATAGRDVTLWKVP